MGTNFKYVGDYYKSNCFVEAMRAKLKNNQVTVYYCKPRITENGHFQMPHFMWSDGVKDYDFSDTEDTAMPWYRLLAFTGKVREFPRGFAEKYALYRKHQPTIFGQGRRENND